MERTHMAARKSKPKGRIPGSKNVKRSRLVAATPGEVTASHCELAHRLAMAQLSDAQIATALGVSEATLNLWKTISWL
jgi:3-mercaptopyruvate sulfurtransferase SseA